MIVEPRTKNQNQTYFQKTFRATITADQLLKDYQELGQWQKVAKKYKVAPGYIIMARKWLGIFVHISTKGQNYSRERKNYKGKYKEKRGYIVVNRYEPENNHQTKAFEHVLVMEKHIGRRLRAGEAIHHIDDNKSNNALENLYLCDHSKHRKADLSAQQVCYKLYRAGLVTFDKEEGIYKIVE